MKTISSLSHLEEYGIVPLTGEADNLGFRILCDLTKAGQDLVCYAFGFFIEGFAKPWNHGSDLNPHVASVMLDPATAVRTLGIMALVMVNKCHTVLVSETGTLFGLEMGELYIQGEWKFNPTLNEHVKVSEPMIKLPDMELPVPWPVNTYGEITRIIRPNISHPSEGGRNVHAMSGRSS